MRIEFYAEGHYMLANEVLGQLILKGADVEISDRCLCSLASPRTESLDAVIAHPEYTNMEGCWQRINGIISRTPQTHFFVFADAEHDRQTGIGKHPNITYLEYGNLSSFMRNPMMFIEQHIEEAKPRT